MKDLDDFIDKKVTPLLNQVHRLQIRYYYDIEINLSTLEKKKVNESDLYDYFIGKGLILDEPESDRNNNIRTDLWSHATNLAIQETSLLKILTEINKQYPEKNLKKIEWVQVKGLHLQQSKKNDKIVYTCTIKSIKLISNSTTVRQSYDSETTRHVKVKVKGKVKEELKKRFVSVNANEFNPLTSDIVFDVVQELEIIEKGLLKSKLISLNYSFNDYQFENYIMNLIDERLIVMDLSDNIKVVT